MIPASSTVGASPAARDLTLTQQHYAFLQQYIQSESGIVIEADKQYLLESRLTPLLRLHGLESLDALSIALAKRASPPLGRSVIEAMTTHETLFFRDTVLYEALKKDVLPSIINRTRGLRPIRIWSAAASSGQEAYSVSMTLLELGTTPRDFEILGTDLSTQVLDKATKGRYGQFEISRGLPSALMMKYFSRVGLEWELQEQVRRSVRFQQFDLRKDPRFLGTFDLVLCRNVLIYFDTATKSSILGAIRDRLFHDGLLVLGCAETTINIHNGFRREVIGQSAFYHRTEGA